MLIGSIPLMMTYHPETEFVIFDSPEVLILITLVQSWLLVAEIPLFSLKFKHYRWKENEVRYVFISLSALLLAILYYMAIPIIIFLYILISLLSRGTSQPHEKV
jgi:CDP-diacylglycerol--serine O-phosphatidyltransferase